MLTIVDLTKVKKAAKKAKTHFEDSPILKKLLKEVEKDEPREQRIVDSLAKRLTKSIGELTTKEGGFKGTKVERNKVI